MSGIIAPSIVTYQYMVSNTFDTYVNVSFPFRVRITDVWFTGDRKLLGSTSLSSGSVFEDSFRVLKLSGLKAKSPKTVLSAYDTPSDWAPFFGAVNAESENWYDDTLKPTIWLGLPDDSTAQVLKDSTTQFLGQPWNDAGFRSSTGRAPDYASIHNPYFTNAGWNEGQTAQHKYKTDMSVMNPDEMLSLFVWNADGDWTDYAGDGMATIHIAYTGVGAGIEPEAAKTPWNDWWYD